MHTWKLIITSLLIGNFSVAFGQAIDSIPPSGVACIRIGSGEVEPPRWMRHWSDEAMSLQQLSVETGRIESELLSHGYVAFERTEWMENDTLIRNYSPGNAYMWGGLVIDDDAAWVLSKAGVNLRRFGRKPLSPKRLGRMMDQGLVYLEDHGFPFARFVLDSVQIQAHQVTAKLVMEKGRFVLIDSVVVHGDLKLRESYLTNYLGIKEGSPYSERAIRAIPDRIASIRFMESVRTPTVTFEEDLTKVNLYLNRKNASSFDGVVGFLPNPDDGSILITGDVKLHLENALKQGEIVDLNWRKLQTNTQELRVDAISPYLLNSGLSLDGNLKIYRRDTLFTDVFRQVGLRYGFGAGDYFRLFFDRQTSSLISVEPYANGTVPPFLDRAVNAYGVGLRLEKLDYRLNPSKGYFIDLNAALGSKQIIENQRLPEQVYEGLELRTLQWKGAVEASYYITLVKRLVWHQQNQTAFLFNDQLFNNEAYRIGGLRTLRGFDEESMFATSYSIVRSELRYQIDRDGYVFGFFDGAWYENASLNKLGRRRDLPYGFGAGIAFGTKAGNFSLSYALGRQQDNPVALRASKIHFGFLSLF